MIREPPMVIFELGHDTTVTEMVGKLLYDDDGAPLVELVAPVPGLPATKHSGLYQISMMSPDG